ncbi:LysE/ArgO family amino acid transporter [Paenibacillus sp. NRS-1783]|uniref:LysE/ArgO family amino acid transporter n=1 Tax=Paenibacillus sp. NRS-1783 TaxID=3233907 RepID=UPI003D299E0D
MLEAIIHAVLLALGLILPLGVQNVFVFNQGASQPRFRNALPVVITAGVCDTVLIGLAVGGVSLILQRFLWLTNALYAAGYLFLLYMAWTLWKSKAASSGESQPMPPKRQMIFAASVSLLNPHAILDTVGVIGTSSLQYDGGERWAFGLAAVSVSWIWFMGLATAGRLVGHMDSQGSFGTVLNKISALIILGLAIYMAVNFMNSI